MKLSEITTVSELLEILDWDLDGKGMVITDGDDLAKAIAETFPELEDDIPDANPAAPTHNLAPYGPSHD